MLRRALLLCRTSPASPSPISFLRCRPLSLTALNMAKEFVDKEIVKPVVVFSKSYCPFCKMAKDALNTTGVQYALHELDERSDGGDIQDYLLQLTGARSVPRVFIGGKCIGGGTEMRNLQETGQLVPLLKSAGAL